MCMGVQPARYGITLWSGDIQSTFESLRIQVRAGLNVGLSGIPGWTTDIGGFFNGDSASPRFRELIVRWFQYGTFCPIFRLHGHREPAITYPVPNSGLFTNHDNMDRCLDRRNIRWRSEYNNRCTT